MKPKSEPPHSVNDLPALRNFLRGYFHQDMKDEYGSATGALLTFCKDASADEKTALANDWSHLITAEESQPIQKLNQVLTQRLGSSYSITADEVQQMTAILKEFSKTR